MPPRSELPESASQPPIDRRVCAELGAELSRVRVSRGLSMTDVGRDLLLSNRQVQALERVDFSAFYSVAFFLGALRKYAKLCGLDPARVDAAAPPPSALAHVDPPLAPVARPLQEAADPAPQPPGRLALVPLVLAVGVGAVAGGYALWQRVVPPETAVAALPLRPPPAPPVSVAAAVAAPSVAPVAPTESPIASPEPGSAAGVGTLPSPTSGGGEPLPDAVGATAPGVTASPAPIPDAAPVVSVKRSTSGYGAVRLSQATWIFLRRSDSSVTERVVEAGETIPLEDRPVYLALGSPEAVLTIGAQSVDTSRFVRNGQLRMNAGDFSAAESAVTASLPAPAAQAR